MAAELIGLTKESFGLISRAVRHVNRTMEPLPRITRRVSVQQLLTPYIVTQKYSGANTAIVRDPILAFTANPSYPTFSAQLYHDTPIDLSAIDSSKDETVSSLCLTGSLFTGQVFLCLKGSPNYALGGDAARFRGVITSVSSPYRVDITYNASTTTSPNTANVAAANETGATLSVGQNVMVDLINAVGTENLRWRISEYTCP